MKIKTKVFLLFLATLLLTGAVYTLIIFPMSVADELSMIVGSLNNQVDQTDRVLAKYRSVAESDISAIIKTYELDQANTLENREDAQWALEDLVLVNPQIRAAYLVRPQGETLWSSSAESPLLSEASDNTKLDWYQSAVENPGKLVFSNLKKDPSTDSLLMYGAIALPGSDGKTLNVLGFEMDAALLQEFLKGINFRETGIYGAQMDNESMLIQSGKPIIIERNKEITHQIQAIEMDEGKGVGEVNYNGKTYYIATSKSKSSSWTYLFLIDDQGIHQLVIKKVVPVLGISGLMTLGALLVLLFLVQILINKPLVKISKMTTYIADTGDLSQTLEIKGKDEISQMAASFNKMMLELSNNRSNLESIVNDRTRELRKMIVAIEQSPSEIVITDRSGMIEYVNNQALRDTGYSLDELIGAHHNLLISEHNPPELHGGMMEALDQGVSWAGDMLAQRKNGETVWSRVLIAPVFDNQHEISGFISVSNDISIQKEAQEQLLQAKKDAETAARAKSDFLANMSHEIRTPMNAIIGLNGLLEATDLTPRQMDYVTKIGKSADNLLGVINDILDFSKIEAGKLSVESEEFSLDDVVDNISSVIGMKAFQDGLEFVVDRDPSLPEWLVGDSLRINQILLNLAGNAVKFTPSGEVLLSITKVSEEPSHVEILFEVRDTGIGMTEEQVSRLFQAFSQADTSTTRRFGGTGLGLAISKDLVELMGGRLRAESQHGEGSRFWFSLCLPVGNRQDRREKIVPEEIRKLRIAVVDDNDNAREVYRSVLADIEHPPLMFSSGYDAVAYYVDHPLPDLFIMDYRMKGLSGVETWMKLQDKLDWELNSRILLITAYGRDDVIREAQKAGIDQILMKPILKPKLMDTILQMYHTGSQSPIGGHGPSAIQIPQTIRGASILLAEDNEINRQVATELLQNQGFRVTVACNGQEVLQCLEESAEPFDLILMDLQMPVLDGYQATEALRKSYPAEGLPVLALSADVIEGVAQRIEEAGMQGHIAKPINPAQLFREMERWIKPGSRVPVDILKAPEPVAQITFGELQSRLQSFNLGEGLERLSGNIQEYGKLLLRFRESNEGIVDRYQEQLTAGEMEEAKRTIHTLKGVAGNIGAYTLSQLAKTAEGQMTEAAGEDKPGMNSGTMENLRQALRQVIDEIDGIAHLFQATAPHPGIPLSAAEAAEALRELEELLDTYDTEAEERFEALKAFLDDEGYGPESKMIQGALGSYDFDTAARLVKGVAASLGDKDR